MTRSQKSMSVTKDNELSITILCSGSCTGLGTCKVMTPSSINFVIFRMLDSETFYNFSVTSHCSNVSTPKCYDKVYMLV